MNKPRVQIFLVWLSLLAWVTPLLAAIVLTPPLQSGWFGYVPLQALDSVDVGMTKLVVVWPIVVFMLWEVRPYLVRILVVIVAVVVLLGSYLLVRIAGPSNALARNLTFHLQFHNAAYGAIAVVLELLALLSGLVAALVPVGPAARVASEAD